MTKSRPFQSFDSYTDTPKYFLSPSTSAPFCFLNHSVYVDTEVANKRGRTGLIELRDLFLSYSNVLSSLIRAETFDQKAWGLQLYLSPIPASR